MKKNDNGYFIVFIDVDDLIVRGAKEVETEHIKYFLKQILDIKDLK